MINDRIGLQMRDQVGVDQIMFEVDFPHGDSAWPASRQALEKLAVEASLNDEELCKIARGNAIHCYGLERFGITV